MRLLSFVGLVFLVASCNAESSSERRGGPDASATGGSATSQTGGSPGSGGATGGAGGASASGGAPIDVTGGQAGAQATAGSGGDGVKPGPDLPKRFLLYSYSSIGKVPNLDEQVQILTQVLQGWGYEVDSSEDPAVFTAQGLSQYAGVGFINTCGEVFGAGMPSEAATEALSSFVDSGGGIFATHCASVSYTNAPATDPASFNKLLGGRGGDGYFAGESQCSKLADHPTVNELPATFSYTGDTDNTDYLAGDAVVVVRCKWSGNGEREVAASWYRTQGLGRIFFTTFAKTDADLKAAMLRDQHLLPALGWVLYRY